MSVGGKLTVGGDLVVQNNIRSVGGGTVCKAQAYSDPTGSVYNVQWAQPEVRIWVDNSLIGAVEFSPYSDPRFKRVKAPMIDVLDKLCQLSMVQYEWDESMLIYNTDSGKLHFGVLSTQVEEVFSDTTLQVTNAAFETIKQDPDRRQSLVGMDMLLLRAVQEMCEKIERLEARVVELESRLV